MSCPSRGVGKYDYHFSPIDLQSLLSDTFKIKSGWILVCHKRNSKNIVGTII